MASISVLMSVYNENLKSFSVAVNSILDQDYEDFDFIIINDNPSEDKYRKYVLDLNDKRIRYYDNSYNIGLAQSMNRAAALSDAEYIARMDADDYSEPNRLTAEYKVAVEKNADVVYSPCIVVDEYGRIIRKTPYHNERYIYKKLPTENPIIHPSVLIKRRSFINIGGYNNYYTSQDYDLWLRMFSKKYSFHGVNDYLIRKTDHIGNISSSKAYLQLVTGQYISYQYIKYLKNKNYTFSQRDYDNFLLKMDAYSKKKSEKADRDIHNLFNIKDHKDSKITDYIRVYIQSPFLVKNAIYKRIIKILVMIYGNRK